MSAEPKTVYQTLEDRETNLKDLVENGPYLCKWDNAWLGEGYYFWDTFLENAHWWGKTRKYIKGYIICQAICDYSDDHCFDLVGNTDHINIFSEVLDLMEQKGLVVSRKTTVSRVLQYLRKDLGIFNYKAIRVQGIFSKSHTSPQFKGLPFENHRNRPFLDLSPPIQICFYGKNVLDLREYRIIYPDKYIDGNTI